MTEVAAKPVYKVDELVSDLKGLLYANPEVYFPPEIDQKYRDNFKLFDRDNDGYINEQQVKVLLVSVDVKLEPTDVTNMYEYLKEGEKGITEEDFFIMVMKKLKDENKEAELLKHFRAIDKENTGTIKDMEIFKDLLMSKGLKMSEEDADGLLAVINPKGAEECSYGEFCKIVTAKDDGKKGKKKKGGKKSKGK